MTLDLSRRGFFAGLGATLIAAPAIVRAGSLMPVKAYEFYGCDPAINASATICGRWDDYSGQFVEMDEAAVVRRAFVPRLYVQLWKQTPLQSCIENGFFDD
jgi:hypothetical protein